MIEELISKVLAARDVTHREHWRTNNDAKHRALESFYESALASLDELVECYQGQFGMVGEFQVETSPVGNITTWLQAESDWIASNRDELAQQNSSIANLIDGLVAVYQRTIYKLTHLS